MSSSFESHRFHPQNGALRLTCTPANFASSESLAGRDLRYAEAIAIRFAQDAAPGGGYEAAELEYSARMLQLADEVGGSSSGPASPECRSWSGIHAKE